MDWATFLQDNSASIFTLVGVFLGSAITFLISYLNNRFEAKERDKDRAEQRRESKIQAREKWIERDILRIMDLLDTMMKLITEEQELYWSQKMLEDKNEFGLLTKREHSAAVSTMIARIPELIQETDLTWELMGRLAYSFQDDDIRLGYQNLRETHEEWTNLRGAKSTKKMEQQKSKLWSEINQASGEFHRVLREKLISLRDS